MKRHQRDPFGYRTHPHRGKRADMSYIRSRRLMVCCRLFSVMALLGLSLPSDVSADDTVTVLRDEFEALPTGPLSKVLWARAEYHYLPESEPKGPWSISCYSSALGSQRAWKVVEHAGRNSLLQIYTPGSADRHVHPIVAGDPLWKDYVLNVTLAPLSRERRSGVIFRMRNDRCYYFFGVEDHQAVLKMVQHETSFRTPFEIILAKQAIEWLPGEDLPVRIQVDGPHITASVKGQQVADLQDSTYALGRIGLTSDIPTRFSSVEVTMTPADKQTLDAGIQDREATEARLQAANPAMTLWKNISLGDFGVGRNLRFGDLNQDGQIDVLVGQMRHYGPKDKFSELSCLTAITFDGRILWQKGEPDPWKDHLTNDVAFQVHDLDGDGRNEVIYTMDQTIHVADGATGETKIHAPTPVGIPDARYPQKFPRILGDSLFFADLRGNGRADHLVLKDRYTNFWVINSSLQTLWHGSCTTGHYPWAMDMDGDGQEELFVGYSLFDDDGTKLWSLDSQIKDHADAVTAVDLHPEKPGEVRVLCAASDEGFYIADVKGNILKRHRIGHAQNLTVANFRSDLPGLEILIHNYWGNQGIAHFYNAEGELYHDFEPSNHGSVCLPVNWTGNDEEFWCLSPNTKYGGLYDGLGRRVLKFPADGHPDMCYMVLDVTGDCRDEIIVWDPFELSVYTQADSPRSERLYRPVRNPLFNISNYGAMRSIPGWSGPESLSAIDTSGFRSSAQHWRDIRDEKRFIKVLPDQASYAPEQVREIVANIRLFQRDNGGWPKDYDMTAMLSDEQRSIVEATRTNNDTSYDNGNIYSQVDYLARAFSQSGEPEWRLACERGFDFMLRSQYEHGGFPQRFPEPNSFHAHITFNDGVMIGILNVLQDAAERKPHFEWLDEDRRDQARKAVRRGIECILRCQIKVAGVRTGWCQQHDEISFEPRPARTFELASICPQETTAIIRFLMRQPKPETDTLTAMDAAVAWLKDVRLQGVRAERIRAPREVFLRHTTDYDTVVVADPEAKSLWARHYEIGTNRPMFAGRDGIRKYALAEIERERRTGSAWYGAWPADLLDGFYDEWRERNGNKAS